MGRIRTIKPDFWSDSKTGTLSDRATKLFIGMLNYCDDYGVIQMDHAALKAKIFPYVEDIALNVVGKPLMDELLPRGLVLMFTIEDDNGFGTGPYLLIKNFSKHQRVDKPGRPIIPGFKLSDIKNDVKQRINYKFDEHSTNVRAGKEGKGKEGKGKEGKLCELRIGPEAPASPKPESNIQKVVNAYKIAKNISKDDKAWDRSNYPRYSKAAKSILEAFSSVEQAVAYIIVKGDEFNSKDISWTLETLSRHAHDDKGKINDQPHSQMGTNNILELGRPKELSQDRGNGGGGEREVVGFLEEKDHFGSGIIPGFPKAKQG